MNDPVKLAEKILTLLDSAAVTATYKYAVLLALIDLCCEGTDRLGEPPQALTTRQLAEKVLQIYWPHTRPYEQGAVLRQNFSRRGSQAELIRDIRRFRDRWAPDPTRPLEPSRRHAPGKYEDLVRRIEQKLIEMPLARLQWVGKQEHRFLYDIAWSRGNTEGKPGRALLREVRAYQRGEDSAFDNSIRLMPDVAHGLVRLNTLLRPVIQGRWVLAVASINGMRESHLASFLFAPDRKNTGPLRAPLRELQHGECFYCHRRVSATAEVDHFIPWSRLPDNGIENLVLAHRQCNQAKRDHLAATRHLTRWRERLAVHEPQLTAIAEDIAWETEPDRSLGLARTAYLNLPPEFLLWEEKDRFEAGRLESIAAILTT